MGSFTANTTINAGTGDVVAASASGTYNELFRATYTAPFGTSTTGTMQEAIQTHTITSAGYAGDLKYLLIKNTGNSVIELHFTLETWADSAPDTNGAEINVRFMIPVGDYMLLPNIRAVGWDTIATGAGAGVLTSQGITPDANLYEALDTIATADAQLAAEAVDGSETSIDVDDTTFLYPGDLIQLETEILRVLYITSTTAITTQRGVLGSSVATHSDDTPIRLPFFNAYHQYGDTSINGGGDGSAVKCKTDVHGRFKCYNMFGFCRDVNYDADGITPGSFNLQFRVGGGYQDLGLSGITASTHSGLAASTNYAFDIQVDGGTNFDNLTFTTDSSNLNFGGANGVISKIQSALDTQYRTAGNLFERGVTVSIVNGDIRFASKSNRSGSAIALTAEDGADASFFGTGRIPAVGNINAAVAAFFPNRFKSDPKKSPVTGVNAAAHVQTNLKSLEGMCWDDGKGNLLGAASGTISYSTGAMDITSAPPNSDFLFWISKGSAMSGGMKSTDEAGNSIKEFRFRVMNFNVDATIEFIGLN